MSHQPATGPQGQGSEHAGHRHDEVKIDLALQGGGSHGAFTWGVLDVLLEDPTISFDGVSGTSAGALNAAVLATGFARGEREGARQALRALWEAVGRSGAVFGADPGEAGSPFNLDHNPAFEWMNALVHSFSPYQLNPLDINPLRDLIAAHVDLHALRDGPLEVFVTATAVATGRPRVFSGRELSLDSLMASACLPQIFQAVEIEGVAYWDGGYAGNPSLWPLIYDTPAVDLLLIRINPLVRPATPKTAMEILDRVNEITFNAALIAEMRAIAFVKRLIAEDRIDSGKYKDLRLHMIGDDQALAPFHPSSKMSTDPRLLNQLFGIGREVARRWMHRHRTDLGQRSGVDIESTFLSRRPRRS